MDPVTDLEMPPPLGELIARGPLALFVDFDGTLVDIAERPDDIVVPASLGSRLRVLADRLEGRLALVSGRSVVNLDGHLGSPRLARAGSHGSDRRGTDGTALGAPAEKLPESVERDLRRFAQEAGIDIEEKSHGCALHFRRMPEREDEAVAFATRIAREHGLDVKHGKSIVEIVQPGADKGGAVEAFMQVPPFAGAMPVFIGDDITDEDGMKAARALGGFGILVGDREQTAALHRLSDTQAVHQWLGL